MDNMYYFEVPYTCKCELCSKKISGIIKRGPLQIGSNVLSTGLQSGVNSAEMKLSKKLIEGDLENGTNKFFSVENAGRCPHCDGTQSWYPLSEPKKASYVSLYVLGLIIFPLLGMLIWAIFFFDKMIPFIILMALSVFLGIYLPLRSSQKHKEEDKKLYDSMCKEYEKYLSDNDKRKEHYKPEIDWSLAKHIPIK